MQGVGHHSTLMVLTHHEFPLSMPWPQNRQGKLPLVHFISMIHVAGDWEQVMLAHETSQYLEIWFRGGDLTGRTMLGEVQGRHKESQSLGLLLTQDRQPSPAVCGETFKHIWFYDQLKPTPGISFLSFFLFFKSHKPLGQKMLLLVGRTEGLTLTKGTGFRLLTLSPREGMQVVTDTPWQSWKKEAIHHGTLTFRPVLRSDHTFGSTLGIRSSNASCNYLANSTIIWNSGVDQVSHIV